jgi:ABC-type nitrate/sulfonate/bicarbonate transport system ATPase subunit
VSAATRSISLRGLKHRFGDRLVLDSLSFDVESGTFVSVVGPSGCGKSTVLKVLAGLVIPEAGSVVVEGESAIGIVGRTAYMPQQDNLLPWKRVIDNATLGAVIGGKPKNQSVAVARALLNRFGLAGYERAWPSQLSGGMRQRLALLRTFLVGRDVLLLDEPFSALDAITRRDLRRWFESVWIADHRTALLITHDVDEALLLSDRVVVFSERPARVLDNVDVDLPRPRTTDLEQHPDFIAARVRVFASLEGAQRPLA